MTSVIGKHSPIHGASADAEARSRLEGLRTTSLLPEAPWLPPSAVYVTVPLSPLPNPGASFLLPSWPKAKNTCSFLNLEPLLVFLFKTGTFEQEAKMTPVILNKGARVYDVQGAWLIRDVRALPVVQKVTPHRG